MYYPSSPEKGSGMAMAASPAGSNAIGIGVGVGLDVDSDMDVDFDVAMTPRSRAIQKYHFDFGELRDGRTYSASVDTIGGII